MCELGFELPFAISLHFDGAYKKSLDKVAASVIVLNPLGEKVIERGIILEGVHSNNEAKYSPFIYGLECCLANEINRLNVYGDSMLIIKQVRGIWVCKNPTLFNKRRKVCNLKGKFQEMQVQFVPREKNKEVDALASERLNEFILGAVSLKEPKFLGSGSLHDIWCFLETGESPSSLTCNK